jgi:type I restriction enzyme S subunit
VFYDMFGDLFITGKKNNTEYLSAVGDLFSGVAKNANAVKGDFVEVPYMRVANVQDGHINLNEIKTIFVSQQDFNKYLLKENDLLLTEGGDPDKLGRGAVWKGEISPCIHQNHIFRIRIILLICIQHI